MKITYDKEVDAVYIQLSVGQPEGVIEVADGINIDVSSDGKIMGIELLNATEKVSLETTHHIETSSEIRKEWIEKTKKIGITAGASTPKWIIKEVEKRIRHIGG